MPSSTNLLIALRFRNQSESGPPEGSRLQDDAALSCNRLLGGCGGRRSEPLAETRGSVSGKTNMKNSVAVISEGPILRKLDELIDLRNNTLIDVPEKSADSINDWLTINFLFTISYRDLGSESLNQLNIILHGWTSPDPPSLREFSSMLQRLRESIAQGL